MTRRLQHGKTYQMFSIRFQDLRGVAPHMFKSLVGKGHAEFSTNHQQDAQEFLLYLLDMIDKLQVRLNFRSHIRLCSSQSTYIFQNWN